MAIDKLALFESTKSLWPTVVDISADANALFNIYRANEDAHSVDDDWRQLAMWAFHQSLAKLERDARAENQSTVTPGMIEFTTFDEWMRFNLNGDECWAEERAEYELSENPRLP